MKRLGHGYAGFLIIGLFKLACALLLLGVGLGLFNNVNEDLGRTARHLVSVVKLDPENHYIHAAIAWASGLDHKQLRMIQAGTFAYAFLYLLEAVGLILRKRWGGYVTVFITGSGIPLEIYEVYRKPNAMRIGILVVNVAIVAYLIWRLRQEDPEGENPTTDDADERR